MTLLAYHWLFDCAPVAKERLEQMLVEVWASFVEGYDHRDMARRPHPPRRHLEAHLWALPTPYHLCSNFVYISCSCGVVDLDDDALVVDLDFDLVVEVAHQREQNVAVADEAEDDLAPWGRRDS